MSAFMVGLAKVLLVIIAAVLAILAGGQTAPNGRASNFAFWSALALIVGLIGAFI